MKMTWDLNNFEEEEEERNDYHGDYIVDSISEKIVKKDYYPKWKKDIVKLILYVFGIVLIIIPFHLNHEESYKIIKAHDDKDINDSEYIWKLYLSFFMLILISKTLFGGCLRCGYHYHQHFL